MGETKQRSIRVEDDIWIPAEEAARLNGESVSVVIRRALVQYAKENQS